MRIVFMGTPDFAVPVLDALVGAGHAVVAAYTQPPRPGGRRGRERVASPVQRRAEALGIEVRSPERLRGGEEQAAFAALDADVAVVAAYGLILPQPVLDAPRWGCLNVHASLLPRWRGAAPIQRAILAGDDETGVCVMRMEAGLDTGPVLATERVWIERYLDFRTDRRNAGELIELLAQAGAAAMTTVLENLDAYPPVPQPDEGVTYAAKIDKAEARLDFARPAAEIERQVRAFAPAPGAWFEVGGDRVKVLAATAASALNNGSRGPLRRYRDPGTTVSFHHHPPTQQPLVISCNPGFLLPTLLQRAGGKPLTADEFQRGRPIAPDTQL